MLKHDVVICGAGVAGLALAFALGQQQVRVLVLEKLRQESPIHKGEFLQPRTLQILNEWDLLKPLRQRGALKIEALACRSGEGEDFGSLDYRLLPEPFNYGLVHYYHEIKNTFLALAPASVDIRYHCRVLDVLRTSTGRIKGVRIISEGQEEEIEASLTVGADGRTSLIRNHCGIHTTFHTYPHQLLALDLEKRPFFRSFILNFLTKDGIRILYPLPGERARLYIQGKIGEFQYIKQQKMANWKVSLLKGTPGLAMMADALPPTLDGAQIFSAWRYCAPTWTLPGLVLLGDAAHGVHPMAGQGMNSAFADAYMLTRVLKEMSGNQFHNERLVDSAIAHFERVRRAQFGPIAGLSHRMSLLYTTTSPLISFLAQRTVKVNRANTHLLSRLTYNMSGLGYRPFSWLDRLHQFGLLPDFHQEKSV
jgi:2-polyprenyl-6-methoxyphenol hydroxylase-like FAD-dependent oxidoreductase